MCIRDRACFANSIQGYSGTGYVQDLSLLHIFEFAADGCTYTFTMPGESTTPRFAFANVDKSILGAVLEQANACLLYTSRCV